MGKHVHKALFIYLCCSRAKNANISRVKIANPGRIKKAIAAFHSDGNAQSVFLPLNQLSPYMV